MTLKAIQRSRFIGVTRKKGHLDIVPSTQIPVRADNSIKENEKDLKNDKIRPSFELFCFVRIGKV